MKSPRKSSDSNFHHPFIAAVQTATILATLKVPFMEKIIGDFHPVNRPFNDAHYEKMKSDILAGIWDIESGTWIKFDIFGNLIDGQKRICAHIDTNTPLVTNVHWGLKPNAILYIDNNQPRPASVNVTIRDHIIAGTKPSKADFAKNKVNFDIAKWFNRGLAWKNGTSRTFPSERALEQLIKRNSKAFRFVTTSQEVPVHRVGVLSALAIYFQECPYQATIFRDLLCGSGADLVIGSPILALRNYLAIPSVGGTQPKYDHFNTVHCINSFHNGQLVRGPLSQNERTTWQIN